MPARRRARLGRRPAAARRRRPPLGLRSRLPARRRHLRDPARPRRPDDRAAGAPRPPPPVRRRPRDRPAGRPRRRWSRPASRDLLAAEGMDGPDGDASIRITVSRGPVRTRGLLPPDEAVARHHRDPGLAGRAAAGGPPRPAACTSSRRRCAATRRTRWRRSRPRRARTTCTRGWRRAGPAPTTPCSSRSTGTSRRRRPPTSSWSAGPRTAIEELATPSLDCAILPGTTRSWLLAWGDRVGLRVRRGPPDRRPTSPPPTRRSSRRASPGSCP